MKKEFQIISELIDNNKRVLDVGWGWHIDEIFKR